MRAKNHITATIDDLNNFLELRSKFAQAEVSFAKLMPYADS
jgi:hypothetical protein